MFSVKYAVLLVATAFAVTVIAQTAIYAEPSKITCDNKGVCKVNLGSAGNVQLPALVAFKTAHDSYLSVAPPNGGTVWLAGHPKKWEEWEMERVGDKVALKSSHGTYLSQKWSPRDGYEMVSERLAHELFTVEEKGGDKIAFRGHNGMYISADGDAALGIRQEFTAKDWELFTVEYTREGHVAIKSAAHGTYLGASNPASYGRVSQQDTLNTWETFVIDHVDKEKLTIETSHDTYLASHADPWHTDKVVVMDRASIWELWSPYVNKQAGTVCMRGHDGRFMQAIEDKWSGFTLNDHCMEHELMTVVLVNEKMLAEAAKAAAEARKAAEAASRAAA